MQLSDREFWVKIVDFLQQNWALVTPESAGTVKIHFMGDTGGIFDELNFQNVHLAREALARNDFEHFDSTPSLKEFLYPPSEPYHRWPHPNGPIYSSGRYWKNP